MKIAFTGTSSTGKTTTALSLMSSGLLSELGLQLLRPPNTRESLKKRIDELSNTDKLAFQKKRFEEKIRLEADSDNFIVERSFIDLLAYRYLILPIPSKAEIANHIDLAKRYSLHFFFPYGVIPYEEDGSRPEEKYSIKVSTQILKIMDFNKIQYISLTNFSLKDRCDIIYEEILKFKQLIKEK